MGVKIGTNEYLNQQEQIAKNANDIAELKKTIEKKVYTFVLDMSDFTYSDGYTYQDQYARFFTTQEIDENTKFIDLDTSKIIYTNATLKYSSYVRTIYDFAKSEAEIFFTTSNDDNVLITPAYEDLVISSPKRIL